MTPVSTAPAASLTTGTDRLATLVAYPIRDEAAMSGRVFKRSATWSYVVNVGTNLDGKRKQRMKGGFLTKREADRALRDLLRRLDENAYVELTKQTLGKFLCDEWLPAMQPPRADPGDQRWSLPLRWYSVHVVACDRSALYAALITEGREDGTCGLAPETVRDVHATLGQALKDATRSGKE